MVRQIGLQRSFEFTVTTPDNCEEAKEFQKRWHSLYTNVLRPRFASGCAVKERQARGAWHMHCVVQMPFAVESFPWNEVRNGCYKHVDRRLLTLWRYFRRILPRYGFGRFRLVPIWSNGKAAGRYFGKYVAKSFAERDERDHGIRRWCTWGAARRATCSFAFVKSQARHKIAWMAGVLGLQWYEDFKELLGPRWAYYLFPLLNRENWEESRNAVWVVACLLRDGYWKIASWVSREVEMGANGNLDELCVFRPFIMDLLPLAVAPSA